MNFSVAHDVKNSELENGKVRLYEKIANLISGQIRSGVLRAGDRAPSVREIRKSFHVSASTAIEVCSLLENRRLVEARPKSGFYVRSTFLDQVPLPEVSRTEKKPHPGSVSQILETMLAASSDSRKIDFGTAVPSDDYFPHQKLSAISARIVRERSEIAIRYSMAPGAGELRRALARRMLQIGCPVSHDEIIITCGCTEAMAIAVRSVTKPGDIVAVESPSYFGTIQALKHYGLKFLEIATDPASGMRLDALEKAIRQQKISAVTLVANFNNPLGSCMGAEQKRETVALLAKHGIPLIEDDIYGDIHFGEERPLPFKSFDTKGNVIYCTSFSKTVAPGLRLGFISPGAFYSEALQCKREMTLGSSTLSELVLAEFLKHGGYDAHLRKIRREYAFLVGKYSETIARSFPEGIRITRPQGGFVIWIELPKGVDAVALQNEAMKKNISIAPGRLFSPRGHFPNFIRINCARRWSPAIEKGLVTLGELARNLCIVRSAYSSRRL